MEGTHGKLCPRLSDRLCGDNADCFALAHNFVIAKIISVACLAHTAQAPACQRRPHHCAHHFLLIHQAHLFLSDHSAGFEHDFSFRIFYVFKQHPAECALSHGFIDCLRPRLRDLAAFFCFAIAVNDDDVLRYIHKPPRKIPGRRCTERRIGCTFARAVRRNEVLKHVESFLV